MFRKHTFSFLTLMFLMAVSVFAEDRQYKVSQGHLDLESPEIASKLISLSGEWEFYYNKTPDQIDEILRKNGRPDCIFNVPGYWNDTIKEITGSSNPRSKGCFRLMITNLDPSKEYSILIKDVPSTSCAVLVNEKQLAINGDPYLLKRDRLFVSHSVYKPVCVTFYPDVDGNAEVIVFVNNFYYRKSGLYDTIFMGPKKNVQSINNLISGFDIAVSGLLLFLGVLNLIQFFINKKKKEYLYIGLVSLGFSIRVAVAGYCALAVLFPKLPGEIKMRLEYISIWLTPPVLLSMMNTLYPPKKKYLFGGKIKTDKFQKIVNLIPLTIGALTIILPSWIGNYLVTPMEITALVFTAYGAVIILVNVARKSNHILFYMASMLVLMAGLVLDVIYSKFKGIMPISLFPIFLVAFSFIQIALLARIQHEVYGDTILGSNKLKKVNDSLSRFVPQDMLRLINEDSILEVKRGDSLHNEMSITFSRIDISKVPSADISDVELNTEVQFNIFNEIMKLITPVIRKHDGVLAEIFGTGFIALFPQSPNDAVLAGLEAGELIKELAEKYYDKGYVLKLRTGIHWDKILLGTVGEEENWVSTMFSDCVESVLAIEKECEIADKQIVLSQSVKDKLMMSHLKGVCLMDLKEMPVKNSVQAIKLYDCIFINGGDLEL